MSVRLPCQELALDSPVAGVSLYVRHCTLAACWLTPKSGISRVSSGHQQQNLHSN